MPDNDEQFMQRRLLLASLISAMAIMAYFYMAGPREPVVEPEPRAAQEPTPAPQPEPAPEPEPEPAPAEADEPAEAATVQQADHEQEITVETDAFRVVLSNRGAVAKHWVLKAYKDSRGAPLDLIHAAGAEKFGRPFELVRPGGVEIAGQREALFVVDPGPELRTGSTEVSFTYSDGSKKIKKTFRFKAEGHVFELETEMLENGSPQQHLVAWPGGFGDTTHQQDAVHSMTLYLDPATGDFERNSAGDAEDARLTNQGPYEFVGLEDHFFTAVFVSPPGRTVQLETGMIEIQPDPQAEDEEQFVSLAVGAIGGGGFEVYVGPKDVDELQAVDRRMREIIDYGFFGIIAEPLFLMMRWVHSNVVANWGWSIVLVTIFINLALLPLKWKGSKSMKRMQQLQPLVKQINDKYKGLKVSDPKKQEQNEELMALYKKYKVNPVGGCFPMLLQMPFFFAFYTVLTVAIEMRQAEWLWVPDLSQPETLAIRVLPLTMMATQFWMQALTPMATVDPAQAKMMKFMPLMMGFIFYGFQAGLVLYWLTSNLVGVGQQMLLNKLPGEEMDLDLAKPRGKKKKK